MAAADGLPRKEEDGSAILSILTISGRQADTSWLHLSRKQDRLKPRSEHYRRLPPFWPCANTQPQPSTKGNPMRPVIRYQSQLLYRKSYKPSRVIRIRVGTKPNFVFRPARQF